MSHTRESQFYKLSTHNNLICILHLSLVRTRIILHHQHSPQTASLQAAVLRYPSVGFKSSFLSQDQRSQHGSLWPWLRTRVLHVPLTFREEERAWLKSTDAQSSAQKHLEEVWISAQMEIQWHFIQCKMGRQS